MHYYFGYGSNMNPARVAKRKMPVMGAHPGVLFGHALRFNKRSTIYPGAASANVVVSEAEAVEGVLYELKGDAAIEFMDPFEGYPVRYDRFLLPVQLSSETAASQISQQTVQAWVYIANKDYIQEGLQPAKWYLDHLLAGKEFLSTPYFNALQNTQCLPDSNIEP